MADENVNNNEGQTDYIEVIKNLKSTTVDKAKYDALAKEKQDLLKALAEGKQIESPAPEITFEECITKHAKNEYKTDVEFFENALRLSDFFEEAGASSEMYFSDEIYEAISDALEESKGKPKIFKQMLAEQFDLKKLPEDFIAEAEKTNAKLLKKK